MVVCFEANGNSFRIKGNSHFCHLVHLACMVVHEQIRWKCLILGQHVAGVVCWSLVFWHRLTQLQSFLRVGRSPDIKRFSWTPWMIEYLGVSFIPFLIVDQWIWRFARGVICHCWSFTYVAVYKSCQHSNYWWRLSRLDVCHSKSGHSFEPQICQSFWW